MKKVSNILIVLFISLTACLKVEELPIIPHIEFQRYDTIRTSNDLGNNILIGNLKFTFEDGDGDIGILPRTDTVGATDNSRYNLFLTIHEKVDGEYRKIDNDELDLPLNFRIPPLDREGQNKTLRGTIEVELEYYKYEYDSIRYSFYIIDRQFHKSNEDTTQEIVFTRSQFP